MALGANRPSIAKWVLAQGALIAACGVTIGLGAALLVTRLLTSLLFSTPSDPATFLVVACVLTATALGACLPTRHQAGPDGGPAF